jgi:hypothetical protein
LALDAILAPLADGIIAVAAALVEAVARLVLASVRLVRYAVSKRYRAETDAAFSGRRAVAKYWFLASGALALAACAIGTVALVYFLWLGPNAALRSASETTPTSRLAAYLREHMPHRH